MKTSYFARVKTMTPEERQNCVAIAIGVPGWYKGRRCLSLAPTRAMLKMAPAQYDPLYAEILSWLSPNIIALELGADAILLCWEKPGVPCHRRTVAEWLKKHLGLEVPEL